MLYIKRRLDTEFDLSKLCVLTIVCALVAIPMVLSDPGVYGGALDAFFATIGFELYFLVILVLPPSLGSMGIAYFETKRREKRIEKMSYGYMEGFSVGLLLILFLIPVGALLGLPAIGFCVGVGLSFVSVR